MPKSSPNIRSFNAGEFSPLMEGRTDIEVYPASCRSLFNTVTAFQGPAICRGGTEFQNTAFSDATTSALVPFIFSELDFYMIEFADNRIRFFLESGLLTYSPQSVTAMSTGPFTFTSATLGALVGDQVVFSNFPNQYNLNGVVGNVINKVGNVYTVDVPFPALATLTTFNVSRVYHIASPYPYTNLHEIRDNASLDVVYLTHAGYKTYKLQRFDTYNWQFTVVDFEDGPYLAENETSTTLRPNVTGKATITMTASSTGGATASADSEVTNSEAFRAFDNPESSTYWQNTISGGQRGNLIYEAPAAFVLDGYSIHMATENGDASYTAKDYAPSNWEVYGSNDGVNYTLIDKQNNYVLYDNNKTVFIRVANANAYKYYQLRILSLVRNGPINVRVRSWVLRSSASASITITASSTLGINNGQGFKTTDVGRLIRMKGTDNSWRSLKITSRTSATVVVATLLGEPFADVQLTSKWRLGAYSDTTGYASDSVFHDDRLWLAGTVSFPDFLAASSTDLFENMSPTTESGEVLATNGISTRIKSKRLSKLKWLASNKDGLAAGTGSKEYVIKSRGQTDVLNPKDGIRAVDSGSRGSADVRPVEVDAQVLFVSRGGRTLREFAYTYESDGYKSPSMSSLASHLGVSPFKKIVYAAEPFNIAWVLRQDGSVVGLTYNRDENVVGWHRHDFGGVVESIAVLPSSDQLQDVLWMVIVRQVNGVAKRYVEKLTRFWDFNMTIADAFYVDCGLRYVGAAIDKVYGLSHLEGRSDIYGLADGTPVGPLTVISGAVTIPFSASNIVLGIGFESSGETSRLENGSATGTAQGKVKRIHKMNIGVWSSYGGEFGVLNEQTGLVEWTELDYPVMDASMLETISLHSGIVGPFTPAAGYGKNGSVHFRRRKEIPLPLNIISLLPQMDTQDG